MTKTITMRAAAIALAVAAAPAIADDCPPPTEAQCYENPLATGSYWQTSCGLQQSDALARDPEFTCNQIFAAASQVVRDGATLHNNAAVPPDLRARRPDGPPIRWTATLPYDRSADPVVTPGLTSSFAGAQSRYGSATVLGALADAGGMYQVIGQSIRDRDAWEANGNAVGSCDELVYEHFYEYSKFADRAVLLDDNYRAIFDYGYPMFADGVQSRSRLSTTPIATPPGKQPKNVYFTYQPTYPAKSDPALHHAWSAAATNLGLPDKLQSPDGTAAYYHSLYWHGRMNQALSSEGDDPMYAAADLQRAFSKLLALRAATLKRWTDYDEAMRITSNQCERDEVTPAPNYVWPWDKIWDPADRVLHGLDLLQYYGRDAFDPLAVQAPTVIASALPYGAGVFTSRLLDYGTQLVATDLALAQDPNDALALGTRMMLGMTSDAQLIAATPLEVPTTTYEAIDCTGYIDADDGLPVPASGGCGAFLGMTACVQRARDATAAKLADIDAEIESALLDGAQYGCTALDHVWGSNDLAPSYCDWSPEMFAREMAGQFERQREKLYRQCVDTTGGDFGATTHPIHHAQDGFGGNDPIATPDRARELGVPYKNDYTGSTEDVLAYMKLVTKWATEIEFQRDPVNGRPISGHVAGDSDSIGNSTFGVAYQYGAEWRLVNLPTSGGLTSPALCDVGLYAQAGASASGTVFGWEQSLLDAFAKVTNERAGDSRTSHEELRLFVLGDEILPPTSDDRATSLGVEPIVFHVAREKTKDQPVASYTFPVAGVPVTVRAGVAGRIGFAFDARIEAGAACPLSTTLTGAITPSASLDVYVSGGAQLAVAEVGLQIDLTLLRIELPLTLSFGLRPLPDANQTPMIDARPRLELALTTLSGRLRAYLRFPIGDPLYVTLFSWPGVQLARDTVFAPEWSFPLGKVALGLAALGGQ
jgi:hypothetical protein